MLRPLATFWLFIVRVCVIHGGGWGHTKNHDDPRKTMKTLQLGRFQAQELLFLCRFAITSSRAAHFFATAHQSFVVVASFQKAVRDSVLFVNQAEVLAFDADRCTHQTKPNKCTSATCTQQNRPLSIPGDNPPTPKTNQTSSRQTEDILERTRVGPRVRTLALEY